MTQSRVPESPAYIGGPMSGYENFNHEAFYECEAALAALLVSAFNPAHLDAVLGTFEEGTATSKAAYLKRDFYYLSMSNSLVLLPGWEKSTGANAELLVAQVIGLPIWVYAPDSETGAFIERSSLRPDIAAITNHAAHASSERLFARLT